MKKLYILWKFSRPHTIIGSTISITTLYAMACQHIAFLNYWPLLVLAIITGITCNIFIVGINQIEDIEIDKINKPYLPIAAGELSIKNAYRIIYTSALLSVLFATYISYYLTGIVMLSMLIGMAYSLPPLSLKKHHLPAALAITVVRGFLVNIGGFYVFNTVVNQSTEIIEPVWLLTFFIIAFSIAISWFKDMPDTEGDAKYKIKTLAILYSQKTALIAGTSLVGLAFGMLIYYYTVTNFISENPSFSTNLLLFGNTILLGMFIVNTAMIRLKKHNSIKQFYKRFWLFFFAEYALYLIAFI
jgi:homogentisate phytyltransferase/homogentisate geranylgeranyltransferase